MSARPPTRLPFPTSPESLKAGHELSDAHAKGIFWFAIAFILFAVVSHIGLGAMFFALRRQDTDRAPRKLEPSLVTQREAPPAPRLQSNPQADLQTYLTAQRELLNSYGWVNPQQDLVRIPIERAMDLLVQRGPERTGQTGGTHE